MMTNTPVLFLVFNRPDNTAAVFERIRAARPRKLYVAADGARTTKPGEPAICEEVRAIVTKIDWDCELHTLFREKNLGCGTAVSQAITWFFENEEQGIILEDDCLPELTFFTFCEELLMRYKTDERVFQINGVNFVKDYVMPTSYTFTPFSGIWGWATWRSRWQKYQFDWRRLDMQQLQHILATETVPLSKVMQNNIYNDINKLSTGVDTWDFQWHYTVYTNKGLCITPVVNLVTNIGFGENATHTFDKNASRANYSSRPIQFPLKHPDKVERDLVFQKAIENLNNLPEKPINRAKNNKSFLRRIIDRFFKA